MTEHPNALALPQQLPPTPEEIMAEAVAVLRPFAEVGEDTSNIYADDCIVVRERVPLLGAFRAARDLLAKLASSPPGIAPSKVCRKCRDTKTITEQGMARERPRRVPCPDCTPPAKPAEPDEAAVERAAKAICTAAHGGLSAWNDDDAEQFRAHYIRLARAALQAAPSRDAVIEKCAKVAEAQGYWRIGHESTPKGFRQINRGRNDAARNIAAAIRALKSEEPAR